MTDIHDIRPPLPWETGFPVWVWAAGLVAVILVAAVILLFWRKKPPEPEKPPLPAGPFPVRRLAALSAAGDLDDKAFYFELTSVIREEIFLRLGIPALEMTTEEILVQLKTPDAPEKGAALPDEIRDVLVYGDTVKFAGRSAGTARRAKDLTTVGRWLAASAPETPSPERSSPDTDS